MLADDRKSTRCGAKLRLEGGKGGGMKGEGSPWLRTFTQPKHAVSVSTWRGELFVLQRPSVSWRFYRSEEAWSDCCSVTELHSQWSWRDEPTGEGGSVGGPNVKADSNKRREKNITQQREPPDTSMELKPQERPSVCCSVTVTLNSTRLGSEEFRGKNKQRAII